jgi:hypothetical protein
MMDQNVLPFKLEKTEEAITAHAGLLLAQEFHAGLGLGRLVDEFLPAPGSGRGHKPSEFVEPLVLLLQGGGRDLADLRVIAQDRVLREVGGLKRVPAESTVGDWLRRAGANPWSMEGLSRVQEKITEVRLLEGAIREFTLDPDTTIIEADKGDATMAYDGTVGYQPMVGFLAEYRWLVHEEFRPGSMSPGAGAVAFIQACQKRTPEGTRISRLRSDSAFYNHEVTDYCEEQGIQFVIGAHWDTAVKEIYGRIGEDEWTSFVAEGSGQLREAAEAVHTFNQGHSSFRLIFVRDVEPMLFEEIRGRALITNIPLEAMDAIAVVKFYNQRGTAENFIREVKYGAGMLDMPCGQFEANAAWFRIGALAYNLFLMQQAFGLPPELRHVSMGTIRWQFYQVAGRLVRHARQFILRVATDAATFAVFLQLRAAAAAFASP